MSKERDEFMAMLARELPKMPIHQVVHLAGQLIRQGKAINRHAVNLCNIPDYQPIFDKGTDRAEATVAKLLEGTKIKFVSGGDPRGCTLMLVLPSGKTNSFASEGWCVPGA